MLRKRKICALCLPVWHGTASCRFGPRWRGDFSSRRDWKFSRSSCAAGRQPSAALSSGEVDFAEIGGAQAVMRSRARGLDVCIIGAISNATNYQMVGNKSTRTLEDLKGKIVGVTGAGAFSDFAMRIFLRRKGIDPDKDVMLRAIGGSNLRVGALEKGMVAAAPFAPEDTVRLSRLGYPMLANFSDTLIIPRQS